MSKHALAILTAGLLLQVSPSIGIVSDAGAAAPGGVYVQVRSTNLRAQPKQWASSVGQLSFGDRVDVVDHQGDWFKIKAKGGKQGFVHASAFVTDSPELETNSGAANGLGGSQAVLAGKGFDPAVERQFASGDVAVDFAAVDRMERVTVSTSQIIGFIKQGKLAGEG